MLLMSDGMELTSRNKWLCSLCVLPFVFSQVAKNLAFTSATYFSGKWPKRKKKNVILGMKFMAVVTAIIIRLRINIRKIISV